jgi:hypothetical protein
MKQRDFDRLVASVKQAGAIRRGQLKPGRVIEFQADDVRAIRMKLDKSQAGTPMDLRARFYVLRQRTLKPWRKHWRRKDA